ncbi:MAG: hypothetical protein SF051_05535 [Elusimicrobiota bacterium]|nr:hypothetical protein [Elusimicrobiota bacterium]
MTEAAGAAQPWLNITPLVAVRVAAATVCISTGMYYLVTGRREASLDRMWTGAFLCLLSLLAFAL